MLGGRIQKLNPLAVAAKHGKDKSYRSEEEQYKRQRQKLNTKEPEP
jgi:hypothetical protein